ncbi:MAG: hypothetical protein AABN95_21955 [Acidobacteriota bacterium]
MPSVKPSETKKPEDSTATVKEPSQSINAVFNRHYCDYQLALHQIQADAKRSCDEAQDRFSREIHKAQVDAFLGGQEAYHNYLTVHNKSQKDPDKTSAAEVYQAYRDYVKAYQAGQETTQKVHAEAEHACRKEIEQCQENVHAKWRSAFGDYVRALQNGWSEVEPEAISATTLAALGQSIIAATTSAISNEQSYFAR